MRISIFPAADTDGATHRHIMLKIIWRSKLKMLAIPRAKQRTMHTTPVLGQLATMFDNRLTVSEIALASEEDAVPGPADNIAAGDLLV